MWKIFKHSRRIEIPDRSPTHHVKPQWSEDGKVHGSVDLFHEAVLLGAGTDAVIQGHGADESLHQEFAGKGEDNDIECHECEVFGSLAIVGHIMVKPGVVGDERVVGRERVGQEDCAVKRI